MKKEFFETESHLAEARDIALHAEKFIEEKQEETGDSWLGCLSAVIFRIENRLYDPRAEKELGPEAYKQTLDSLAHLRRESEAVGKSYKNGNPSEEDKKRLLLPLSTIFQ